jgi:hypothetical protein
VAVGRGPVTGYGIYPAGYGVSARRASNGYGISVRPSHVPVLHRACACGGGDTGCSCPDQEVESASASLAVRTQPAAGGGRSPGPGLAPPIVHDVIESPGTPLNQQTRDYFEKRLGRDLSQVRLHNDDRAAASAKAVGATAYAVGPTSPSVRARLPLAPRQAAACWRTNWRTYSNDRAPAFRPEGPSRSVSPRATGSEKLTRWRAPSTGSRRCGAPTPFRSSSVIKPPLRMNRQRPALPQLPRTSQPLRARPLKAQPLRAGCPTRALSARGRTSPTRWPARLSLTT